MTNWAGTALVEDEGESCLVLTGPPNNRYDLLVRESRRLELADGKDPAGNLQQGELAVWNFQGKPGEFSNLRG